MSVLSRIAEVFPPPHYLRMPSVGVDISDSSLKYVQFVPDRYTGQTLRLKHWGDIDIPDGVLKRGVLQDPKRLSDVIAEVKSVTGCSVIRVSLPEERAYLFETEIKKSTPLKEVRGILEFRLEENVPISPREALFDFMIHDDPLRPEISRVSVTVYARETVMSYYEATRAAGVMPLSFEVEAQAIARATLPPAEASTHLILDFGKTRTGIGIVHAGTLMYTSTIDIGGAHLSKRMREVLGENIAESELTTLKNTVGLVGSKAQPTVRPTLETAVDDVLDEVKTRIQYWNTRTESHEERFIRSVLLCGGSANMKGLPSYVSEQLNIPTKRANVWQNALNDAATVPPINRRYAFGYATAIGLSLADFIYD